MALALIACAPGNDSSLPIRVGHANVAGWAIYGGGLDAGADLGRLMTLEHLDVLGVSEVCSAQLEALTSSARAVRTIFERTVPVDQPLPWSPPSDAACTLGLGMVFGPSVESVEPIATELPTADGPPGGPDSEEDRHVLCARVTRESETLLICTTHLSHLLTEPGRRAEQATSLLGFVDSQRTPNEPVILLGDFNARWGDTDLAAIADAGWMEMQGRRASSRVQHVIVSPGAWELIDRGQQKIGRSDHNAVWAAVVAP